jgi:hypothetical protein
MSNYDKKPEQKPDIKTDKPVIDKSEIDRVKNEKEHQVKTQQTIKK